MPENSFWDNAAKSLPAPVRDRYIAYFEMAKRWELAWDAAFEAWLGIKVWADGLFKILPSARNPR